MTGSTRNAYGSLQSPSCAERVASGETLRAGVWMTPCAAGACDICDDRRDLQYRYREDSD